MILSASAPVNDVAASCTNLDDTDNLYAHMRTYNFSCSVQDSDGYSDINYVELSCIDGGSATWTVRYTQATNAFSEEAGASYIALSGGQYSKSGIDLDVWFNIKTEWAHPEVVNYDLKQFVIDSSSANDTDTFDKNYDYYNSIMISDLLTDKKGVIDTGPTSGDICYWGDLWYYDSPSYLYPPDNEVDMWVSGSGIAGSPWSDTSIVWAGGERDLFNLTIKAPAAPTYLKAYSVIVVAHGEGPSGTNLMEYSPWTPHYTADNIRVDSITVDSNPVFIGQNMTITVALSYVICYWEQVDDGTVLLNGLSMTHVSGGTWSVTTSHEDSNQTVFDDVTTLGNDYYGINTVDMNDKSLTAIWFKAVVSSVNYYWTQSSVNHVSLHWSASVNWDHNSSEVPTSIMMRIQSLRNGTNNGYCIVSGGHANILIGYFNLTWHYASISIRAQFTFGGIAYDWLLWEQVLSVHIDVPSIRVISRSSIVHDNWITFSFCTNWGNGTLTIWDNDTVVGYSQWEGWYQIAKPTAVGLHNYTLLVNGTHAGSSYSDQTKSFASSDSWLWLNFKYTVNPVELSFEGVTFSQNNESVMIVGRVWTSATTLYYTVYEASLGWTTGTVAGVTSGSWLSWMWDKSDITLESNFSVAVTDGTYNVTFQGFYLRISGDSWMTFASSYRGGDNVNQTIIQDQHIYNNPPGLFVSMESVLAILIAITVTSFVIVLVFKYRKDLGHYRSLISQ